MIKTGAWLTLSFLLLVGPTQKTTATASVSLSHSTEKKENRRINPYGKMPLYFIENKGQFPNEVKYYSHNGNQSALFTTQGLSLFTHFPEISQNSAIKLFPLNANKKVRVIPEKKQGARLSYFYGNRPESWHQNLASYRALLYEEIYDGVDMRFYGNYRQLAYDLIVKPGADPRQIQLVYEGIKGLRLAKDGALEIVLKEGILRQNPPYVYQEISGQRREIPSHFKVLAQATGTPQPHRYTFELGEYDKNQPLIIDPTLDNSSYLGGTNNDFGWAIALDSAGNAYIAGETWSSDFPTQSPLQNSHPGGTRSAFVAKIDLATSTLLYVSYLGGSGEDIATDIAVDSAGNAYVIGHTDSVDFPTAFPIQGSNGGEWDVFVTKINPSGTVLEYSTYLGGFAKDYGRGIAVDAAGGVYLTGETLSFDFPTASAIQGSRAGQTDAFVTKINASGSYLDYSTYLGGSLGDNFGRDIAVDPTGAAYVSGKTNASNFPRVNPIQNSYGGSGDAFITKINPAGSTWLYSSSLGGSQDDVASALAVDAAGQVYLTGETTSLNFPTLLPIQAVKNGNKDFFIAKLNAEGNALKYASYLGGFRNDVAEDITLDAFNNVYITGWSQSSDFPTLNPIQGNLAGTTNLITLKLNAAGTALIYSTYLGAGGNQIGAGIAVDNLGASYLTGWTDSSLFPMQNPVQGTYGGGSRDGFVIKISHPVSAPDITVADSAVPISDRQIPFGNVTIGTSSEQRITLSNDGGSNLSLGSLASTNLLAAPFSLRNNNCSGQILSPASQCTVDVRFSPTSTTNNNDSFEIPSDDPDENIITFSLSGTGSPLPTPDISVLDNIAPLTDRNIPFGDQTQGTSSDQTITLLNTGNANLNIGTIAQSHPLSAPFSLKNNTCSGQELAPTAQCTFVIRFAPTNTENSNDSFNIPSDDADEGNLIVNLSGRGIVPLIPDIAVSDSLLPANDRQLLFGKITTGKTSEETVTLQNTGNADLRIGTFSVPSSPFTITNNACAGQTLSPAGACLISIRFSPLEAKTTNTSFNILSDDPDENPLTVTLSGTGLGAEQNNAPEQAQLRFPANAQQNVATSFDFEWSTVSDPDGDPISYDLYFCQETNPLNCNAIQVAGLPLEKNKSVAGLGTGLFFFGIIFARRLGQHGKKGRGHKRHFLAILLLAGMMLLVSCSSGGGGAGSVTTTNQKYTVTNLDGNTQYFWTVIAKDEKSGSAQSDVWTFTTQ